MDKKLTDAEIVKALECCVNKTDVFVVRHNAETREYEKITIKDILGVINRLQAENERLKDFATAKCRDCAGCTSWKCDCANIEAQAKAEAYKEFAELIKKDFENPYIQKSGLDFVDFLKGVIDNRLKEMVGEEK